MASGDRQNTSHENSDLSESPSPQSKKGQEKKGKAGSSKKMSQKEQSERFIETARELGADASSDLFDRAIDQILPKPANSSQE